MQDGHNGNGHLPGGDDSLVSANPYRDAVSGERPPEIVEFELNTDPYANMLPRIRSVSSAAPDDGSDSPPRRRPLMALLSIVLVVVLVLPVMVEVFARLIH